MTERATGNKHSWLWASHIRTKQSKWLEQNLQGQISLRRRCRGVNHLRRRPFVKPTRPPPVFETSTVLRSPQVPKSQLPPPPPVWQESPNFHHHLLRRPRHQHHITHHRHPHRVRHHHHPRPITHHRHHHPPHPITHPHLHHIENEEDTYDMEEKVENVLNLIKKDGDSFAKRAEMYYKHRPEVINFVEETVRGYRSLAERYDKLSTELQKANTTIASICPEKVTYNDDDDYTVGPSKLPKKPSQKTTKRSKATKIPKAPKPPAKGFLNNYTSKEKLIQNAKIEQQRFDEAKLKLESLKQKFNLDQANNEEETNAEFGDTIDKLVNKMISLETSVTSQTALTDTLKKQNDDLQTQIQNLEAEKATFLNQKNVDNRESKARKSNDVRWLKMLLSGLEDRDDILLQDYIAILKCYKDTKRKLGEEEKRNQGTLSSMKSAIVTRDNTIQVLVQKLKSLQESLGEDKVDIPSIDFIDEPQAVSVSVSTKEQKLRMDIDALHNQNLDLWLTFSNMFSQVYKFKAQVKDLQEEVKKVKAKSLAEKSSTSKVTTDLISDIKPIYKHLKGINTNLTAWLQHSTSLKDELDTINSCLSKIHEEMTHDGVKFSTHEAAEFKGEIWNMKQENNKVNEELEAGLHHAIVLKHEIEQTLERLEMEFGISTNQNQPRKGGRSSKKSVSLRSLLFGGKSKKQKFSFFSCLGHQKRTRSI